MLLCAARAIVLILHNLVADMIFCQPLKYQGFIHAFKTILAEEGVLALYKGLLPRLMRLAPGQAITWTVVEQVNQAFTRFESK